MTFARASESPYTRTRARAMCQLKKSCSFKSLLQAFYINSATP